MEYELWESSAGRSPVKEELDKLDATVADRLDSRLDILSKRTIDQLKKTSDLSGIPGSRPSLKLKEFRVQVMNLRFRFFCINLGEVLHMLHVTIKKKWKLDKRDIETAEKRGEKLWNKNK